MTLLRWLFLLLCPHEEADSLVDPPADDIADLLGEDPAPPAEPTLKEIQEQLRAANERTQRLVTEVEGLRRAPSSPAPVPAAQDPDASIIAQEEARLRDPAITELERWQIDTNRGLRIRERQSQQQLGQVTMTLAQMRDQHDKALYDTRASADKLYKKYAERVEQRLTELRNQGANATRDTILRYLVGEDILSGKLKRRASQAQLDGEESAPARSAPPAPARSDVPRRTGMTEHEKRRARLENVPI
jgi:hypothetical protein